MSLAKDLKTLSTEPSVPQTWDGDTIVFPPIDLGSDEPPLESDLHRDEIELLIAFA
jgi:hypothetical protein